MKKIILLLGSPGSGKGTQGDLLSKELSLPHISTGDIFRKMILDNSSESKLLSNYMDAGKLVPSDLVNKIVKKFILSDECQNGCILDGYPRNIEQAEYFVANIESKVNVIFFNITQDVAIKRILGRTSCLSCGKLYNEFFDKPVKKGVCDDCGSDNFAIRSDDDESIILSRMKSYKEETFPLIEYYKDKAIFFEIDGEKPKKKVMDELTDIVKKI